MYKPAPIKAIITFLVCLQSAYLTAQNTGSKFAAKKMIINQIDSVINASTVAELPQTYFAVLYSTMLSEIQTANEKGHFTDSLLIDYIQAGFTEYYLKALNAYINNESLPFVWQAALDTSFCKSCSYLQWLALGTNAHINHDLYFILLEYFKMNGTKNHNAKKAQKEFFKISARETDRIVGVFVKTDPAISRIEGFFIKRSTWVMKLKMKKFLKTTWSNALTASNNLKDEERATQKQLAFAGNNVNSFLHPGLPIKVAFKMMQSLDSLPFETKLTMLKKVESK